MVKLDSATLAALADASMSTLGEAHPLTTSILLAAAGDLDSGDLWREIEALPEESRRTFAAMLAEIYTAHAGRRPGQALH
jgi:hypothetical protein